MRPIWRWIVHGKPKPPITIFAEYSVSNPKEDALVAMAASLETQTMLMERFVIAAESVASALERAEQRVLVSASQEQAALSESHN